MPAPSNVFPIEPRDLMVLLTLAKGRTLAATLEDELDYDYATLLRSLWRLRRKRLIDRARLGRVPGMKHRGRAPFEYWVTPLKGRNTLRDIIKMINKLAEEAGIK